jgi:hypothetical protein
MAYTLKPAGRSFYLVASSLSPVFDGWRLISDETQKKLVDASGIPVRSYPSRLTFRVSANTRDKPISTLPRDPLKAACSVNEYLVKLGFQMSVFRGLESHTVRPTQVRSMDPVAGSPDGERIYLVDFETKDLPVSDRVVLEVLAPTGERIGKFHLDLY